ncbi:MAG: tRNA guanosine(34) transglycosylase Tgt [Pyrinomonadaceae bacterium]|nr:tRNA guanosine(34) transglycosylase Tgt [Pyrinomonadaceae bacterium]MBP6211934.1 tRNA guanosine(34) transglycosylase Tgt [Pyrinomonadaceae bacterium]
MLKPIDWQVTSTDGEARTGILRTRRSEIETPVFMPVGTQGAVKGVRFEWLEDEMDARIILGNTYHLFLRPGMETMKDMGGLHKFSSWNRSLLTDSGGFQVFSLSDLRKLTEDGVEFRSHLDGSKHFLSPEVSMEIQATLGSEIVMVFDECPPGDAGHEATRSSLEMTARWALRSKDRFEELQDKGADLGHRSSDGLSGDQALFGIVQGAGHLDLRSESLDRTVNIGFDGYAIGGLSVGEEKSVMYSVLDHLAPKMPKDAPRYLMGVGTPEDLLEAVSCGVDMFDCVIPTRNGRTGSAFTSRGKLNIRNAKFARDDRPLDPECSCSVCRRYSLGYLRHLYQVGEMNAPILISHHNLAFFLETMKKARVAIKAGEFDRFRREFLTQLAENEPECV